MAYDAEIRVNTKVDLGGFKKLEKERDRLLKRKADLEYKMDRDSEVGGMSDTAYRRLEYDILANEKALARVNRELEVMRDAIIQAEAEAQKLAEAEQKEAEDNAEIMQEVADNAEEVAENVEDASESTEDFNKNAKKGQSALQSFNKRLVGLAKRVFVFSLVAKGFRAMVNGVKEGLQNFAQFSEEYNSVMSAFKSQTATLENSLASAFAPIVTAIIPIITKLVEWLTLAGNAISRFFAVLQGKNSFAKAKTQAIDYAKSLGQVNKEANKLASFDDINVLQKDESSSGVEITGAGAFEMQPIDASVLKSFEGFKNAIVEIKAHLEALWTSIKSFIGVVVDTLKPSLTWIYENLLKPMGNFLKDVFVWAIDTAKYAFQSLAEALGINGADINNIIISVGKVIQTIGTIVKAVVQVVMGSVKSVIKFIKEAFTTITGILRNVITFIKSIFTGEWGRAWKSLVNIGIGILNLLISAVEHAVNALIDGLNYISFDVPDWVPEWAGGGKHIGFNLKNVSWGRIPELAQGGITNRPTTALIGEAGREAVLPLENNTEWMDILADKIGGGNITLKFDGDLAQLARVLNPVLANESKRIGTRLVIG